MAGTSSGRVAGVDWSGVPTSAELGAQADALLQELYPICRSLTGAGVRETLDVVGRHMPLDVVEVPAGTSLFDWTVPPEWHIRDAWIADMSGRRVVDFADSNLHVLGYSTGIRARMSLEELRPHLHTDPRHADWIPFRTSYHAANWGFCLSQRALDGLEDTAYDVCIDAWHDDSGALTRAECRIPGASEAEVLLSTYVCHPSLANDNLSGIVLLTLIGRYLRTMPLQHTYRLLFGPGTLGPLAWLAANEDRVDRVVAGLALSCVGDPGPFTYKRSRRGDAHVDRVVANVLGRSPGKHRVLDWIPWGGDERQFCSPGFDMPVGAFSRTPTDACPANHSSADDLHLVSGSALAGSVTTVLEVVDVLETDGRFVNLRPKGEPLLGKRGLYRPIAGEPSQELALLWVLNLSDGHHSLLDISDRSGIPFKDIRRAATQLMGTDLLARADGEPAPDERSGRSRL